MSQPKATRFWRMLRIVERLRSSGHIPLGSPEKRVTSAASMAMSVPVPMAIPTSA